MGLDWNKNGEITKAEAAALFAVRLNDWLWGGSGNGIQCVTG